MDFNEILSRIGFDWPVALANLVNFLIIFYLLKRFAFGPIRQTLAARRQKIEQGIEDARKAETALIMAKEEFERHVAEGKVEANDIVSRARTQEKAIVEKAEREAETEASRIKREAEEAIARDRARMADEVRAQAADLITEGVRKLLESEMTVDRQNTLVSRGIRAAKNPS